MFLSACLLSHGAAEMRHVDTYFPQLLLGRGVHNRCWGRIEDEDCISLRVCSTRTRLFFLGTQHAKLSCSPLSLRIRPTIAHLV